MFNIKKFQEVAFKDLLKYLSISPPENLNLDNNLWSLNVKKIENTKVFVNRLLNLQYFVENIADNLSVDNVEIYIFKHKNPIERKITLYLLENLSRMSIRGVDGVFRVIPNIIYRSTLVFYINFDFYVLKDRARRKFPLFNADVFFKFDENQEIIKIGANITEDNEIHRFIKFFLVPALRSFCRYIGYSFSDAKQERLLNLFFQTVLQTDLDTLRDQKQIKEDLTYEQINQRFYNFILQAAKKSSGVLPQTKEFVILYRFLKDLGYELFLHLQSFLKSGKIDYNKILITKDLKIDPIVYAPYNTRDFNLYYVLNHLNKFLEKMLAK